MSSAECGRRSSVSHLKSASSDQTLKSHIVNFDLINLGFDWNMARVPIQGGTGTANVQVVTCKLYCKLVVGMVFSVSNLLFLSS